MPEDRRPIVADISGGINSDTAPWLLEKEFKDLQNIRIRMGALESAFVPALVKAVTLDGGQTMEKAWFASVPKHARNMWTVQSNGKLHRTTVLAASPATTEVDTLLGVPRTSAVLGNWFITSAVTNTGKLQKTDGTDLYALGIPTPSAPTTAEKGGGATGVLDGTYQYRVTFVGTAPDGIDGFGQEGPISAASTGLEVDEKQIVVTVPVDATTPIQTTQRKIYRYGGAVSDWTLVKTLTNNTTTEFDDNISDAVAAVSFGADISRTTIPDGCTIIATAKNRLFATGKTLDADDQYPTRVWFSALGTGDVMHDPTTKDTQGGWFEAGQGDGEAVTAMAPIGSILLVFKESSLYGLFGDHPSMFELRKLANVGAEHPEHVSIVPQGVLFRYQDNVWLFDGKQVTSLTIKRLEGMLQSKATGLTANTQTIVGCGANHESQEYAMLLNDSNSNIGGTELIVWDSNANAFHRTKVTDRIAYITDGLDCVYIIQEDGKIMKILHESGTRATDWKVEPPTLYGNGSTLRLVALDFAGFCSESTSFVIETVKGPGEATETVTLTIPSFTGNYYTRLPDSIYGRKFDFTWQSGASAATLQLHTIMATANLLRRAVS